MRFMHDIKECISRMVQIKNEIKALEAEYDSLEAIVLSRFTADTENTKHKAASYSAEAGNITASEADSVKIIYPTMLKEIFGVVYSDMVKEETSYTLTAAAKRLLSAIYKGEYIMIDEDQSFEKAVMDLPIDDEKTQKALIKKLKGRKYDSDKSNLIKIGRFSETEAADYAYMLSEVANWCDFRNMLLLNNRTEPEDVQKTIDYINSAVTVETSPKISLKAVD